MINTYTFNRGWVYSTTTSIQHLFENSSMYAIHISTHVARGQFNGDAKCHVL